MVLVMTYAGYVEDYIDKQLPGDPIYVSKIAEGLADTFNTEITDASAAVSVAIKRIKENKSSLNLRCFQKGIYYISAVTPFGESGIDKEKLIANKYLLPDIGYETGFRILHLMGLTTLMSGERLIATNVAKDCVRYDKKLDVSICPPKTVVNAANKGYLQTLDILDLIERAPVNAEDPYGFIYDHIKKNDLQYEQLLYYADRYYNKRTVLNLAHVVGSSK
ncbi:MAG: hypothetical protein IJH51_02545 [Christensenellaceae bacterium]|nr:hypothetical protein [Christensenellaceae bacterium]